MQIMTIAYARYVAGLEHANSVELDPKTPYPVIATMQDQIEKIKNKNYGGTMRLGAWPAILKEGTLAEKSYSFAQMGVKKGAIKKISERHRHRYEVNPNFIEKLEKKGIVFSGISPDRTLMEIAELPQNEHPFYLGTQFHPEFKSRPLSPHPLFSAFIKACIKNRK